MGTLDFDRAVVVVSGLPNGQTLCRPKTMLVIVRRTTRPVAFR